MKASINWLKEFVDFDIDAKELAQRLTTRGLEVDKVRSIRPSFSNVVVGFVKKVSRHPDADKLTVCEVDVGREILQIVCGAANVREGLLVPVALPGALLKGNLEIKETKIRQVESKGMICSEKELGLEEVSSGILELDNSFKIGASFDKDPVCFDDIIEFELTPNRGDCLSILGIAREIAMLFSAKIKMPEIKLCDQDKRDINSLVSLSVEDFSLCPVYSGRIIKEVRTGKSPLWLKNRLSNAGIRPINNIVDVTNYVLLEMGQPLHAFDFDMIDGKKIIVRRAKKDERLKSLDGVDRVLSEDMLVIADEKKPVAIAGVMGGEASQVSQNTRCVFLESACFEPISIRKTSKKLNLSSESSYRFERGVDPEGVRRVLDRASELIAQLSGSVIVPGQIVACSQDRKKTIINLSSMKVNNVLGTKIPDNQILDILESLSIKVVGGKWILEPPSYRYDLKTDADLLEEIARVYGYDKIIPQPPLNRKQNYFDSEKGVKDIISKTKNILSGLGLNEVITYSFIDKAKIPLLKLERIENFANPVNIINPISEEYNVMRNSLLPGLLDVISRNFSRGNEDVCVFEIGKRFFLDKDSKNCEKWVLGISLLAGQTRNWLGPKKIDFFYLKGILEQMFEALFIKGQVFSKYSYAPFHPGQSAQILANTERLGVCGQVHPEISEHYSLSQRDVYYAEIDIEIMDKLKVSDVVYKEISKYPMVSRDIAVVIEEDMTSETVRNVILKNGTQLLESAYVFDLYKSEQLPKGKKSIAFSLIFRSLDATLKDAEVEAIIDNIRDGLKKELNCDFR